LQADWPQALEEIKTGFAAGLLYPLYTTAHHTHALFLDDEELTEELRLNQEFLHDLLEAPRPRHPGFFFTECSVRAERLPALQRAGIEYVIFPHLNPRKARYTVSQPDYAYAYLPFRVGEGIVALPRHFQVSQEIWRPLTRIDPEKARYQGYLMGAYPVFDTEYRERRYLPCPITLEQGVEEYVGVLREALEAAPDGGLILYIQDLELMDFGDLALNVLREAWRRTLAETPHTVRFVTPDDVLGGLEPRQLPSVNFEGICWAPEIRPVLRYDGHYPPLEAGELHGIDAVPEIFPDHPFIFWEPGRPMVDLFTWILQAFGFPTTPGVSARILVEEGYQFLQFPPEKRLPLHLRLMKQADNWGWRPEEGRNKRPYLHGFLISDYLLLYLRLYPERLPAPRTAFPPRPFALFRRLPEVLFDSRFGYLDFGLKRYRDEKGLELSEAFAELTHARGARERATMHLDQAAQVIGQLKPFSSDLALWQELLVALREHCRYTFLSLDRLQRAWGKAPDVEFLVMAMYKYLYEIYPPRWPAILEEV
ncbi:MAG: glycoside hydrolase, partial [Candidatus Tectomicrobia bacterium]|nr:glycoside hydrolase [Candidatus Tectomicrobia bacterium]